ncbi:MAG: phosphoribosyl-ATP diphosphatase [Methanothrix sp.]|nr:phosphoribosyl-ATP diphosphatase [Methanothrix sp.]
MILDDLESVILSRKNNPSEDSYVSSLFAKGKDEILKKIGEEAIEVIIASKAADREQIINELADLWFHCMVLMAEDGLSPSDVLKELENRFGKKGGRP